MPWSRLILLTSKLCVKILGHKILITKLLLGLDPQLGNNGYWTLLDIESKSPTVLSLEHQCGAKMCPPFFGSWSRGTIKPTIMINHDYSMIGVESVYSENRGLFLDESWPFIESKISRNKKMIIKNKKNQHWKLYSPLSDFLLLILQIDCCRLLIVFIFHLDAGCWAAGIYIFIYWKLCDMEKEGKLNVRQHIEKERLQLN